MNNEEAEGEEEGEKEEEKEGPGYLVGFSRHSVETVLLPDRKEKKTLHTHSTVTLYRGDLPDVASV